MDRENLKEEIKSTAARLFGAHGFLLVDAVVKQDGAGVTFGLLADKPQGGISLEDCASLNRLLRDELDTMGILSGQYTLEVSSPGLDRPLKTKEDFMRCRDRRAVFFLNDSINGKCEWSGLIREVNETSVLICPQGEVLEIPLIKINKAKLLI
ncbi:MAG: ribosome maturation factor RimP [Candidatus Omnitrophica bacterium]|nr:ribosome maturation factor RimP [Candidatus Omnitrophota bacterium]MDD5770787.1 ribosome maturation factor RimP [Candidatus Omnitrophota bacterium]